MEIIGSSFKLRPLCIDDKYTLAKSANNRKIWLNLTHLLPHPYTVRNAEEFINYVLQKPILTNFTIDIAGKAVGMIGCEPKEGVFQLDAELGYWLSEEHWGKGICSEAVKLICTYAFAKFDLERISAEVFAYNEGSVRVLKKNGFIQEGKRRKAVLKDGTITDLHIFGLLKEELN